MANTKTQSRQKPATPKVAPKTKTVTPIYAAMLGDALAGKFGAVIQRFYVNAIAYHTKQKTTFPRGRIATATLMSKDDALAFITKHEVTSIPPGSIPGQRLFDAMMVEMASLPKAKP